ncbi:MAG: hypothetical protein ABIV43_02085 [Candidatus Saccharimonadales bacterium]
MQPQQPNYGAPAPPPVQPNYDFITNPEPVRQRRSLPGGGSLLSRVLIASIGLIILIIAFAIIRGLLSGGDNQDAMLRVTQQQQAIIHLTTAASQQQTISSTNRNFAISATLVVTSQQKQLLAYLRTVEKQKISASDLSLKVSASLDKQLTDSLTSNTYDTTFSSILQAQMAAYQSALKVAYAQTTGPNGQKLLNEDYQSATLLLQSLQAAN